MRKTWFHYLPFAGNPIRYQADAISHMSLKIAQMEKDLKALRKEQKQEAEALKILVQTEWTQDEMNEAFNQWKEDENCYRKPRKAIHP